MACGGTLSLRRHGKKLLGFFSASPMPVLKKTVSLKFQEEGKELTLCCPVRHGGGRWVVWASQEKAALAAGPSTYLRGSFVFMCLFVHVPGVCLLFFPVSVLPDQIRPWDHRHAHGEHADIVSCVFDMPSCLPRGECISSLNSKSTPSLMASLLEHFSPREENTPDTSFWEGKIQSNS